MKYQQNTEQKVRKGGIIFTSKLKWKFQFVEVETSTSKLSRNRPVNQGLVKRLMLWKRVWDLVYSKLCSSSVKAKAPEAQAACREEEEEDAWASWPQGGDRREVLTEWVEVWKSSFAVLSKA